MILAALQAELRQRTQCILALRSPTPSLTLVLDSDCCLWWDGWKPLDQRLNEHSFLKPRLMRKTQTLLFAEANGLFSEADLKGKASRAGHRLSQATFTLPVLQIYHGLPRSSYTSYQM